MNHSDGAKQLISFTSGFTTFPFSFFHTRKHVMVASKDENFESCGFGQLILSQQLLTLQSPRGTEFPALADLSRGSLFRSGLVLLLTPVLQINT